jgi:hypothetical protein
MTDDPEVIHQRPCGVEDPGDSGMIHHAERLPFGVKGPQEFVIVSVDPDELGSNPALTGSEKRALRKYRPEAFNFTDLRSANSNP